MIKLKNICGSIIEKAGSYIVLAAVIAVLVITCCSCNSNGADQPEGIWKYVQITCSGQEPDGVISVRSEKYPDLCFEVQNLQGNTSFVNGHLCNGDEVKIVLITSDEKCKEILGYVPDKKTTYYTVEGLDHFVTSVADIPEETYNMLNEQAQNVFNAEVAQTWEDPTSRHDMTLLGTYLLYKRDMDSTYISSSWRGHSYNVLFYVYKISTETFDYYYYVGFDDIMKFADGTCIVDYTDPIVPSGSCSFGMTIGDAFCVGDLWYVGFEDLDLLYNECVVENIEIYDSEDNVGK